MLRGQQDEPRIVFASAELRDGGCGHESRRELFANRHRKSLPRPTRHVHTSRPHLTPDVMGSRSRTLPCAAAVHAPVPLADLCRLLLLRGWYDTLRRTVCHRVSVPVPVNSTRKWSVSLLTHPSTGATETIAGQCWTVLDRTLLEYWAGPLPSSTARH